MHKATDTGETLSDSERQRLQALIKQSGLQQMVRLTKQAREALARLAAGIG